MSKNALVIEYKGLNEVAMKCEICGALHFQITLQSVSEANVL